ncbi:hypothetical protein F1C15_01025 [Frigoribacterium sp. NBH87]|uniref:hypothetical protein n=1 Tax=Frigoribacterium sp. NBH87 TaxID=2596916 RepID=UPI001625436A|nr:hypothetical protein [Frigoribacterium sp. NBH87]QNE42600.1 hypothetical protein F1C15_01025 [Frigoribacterium sp. NBH87]
MTTSPLVHSWAADAHSWLTASTASVASHVAPLVARARGYRAVTDQDAKTFAREERVGNANSHRYQQMSARLRADDLLVVPAFLAIAVANTPFGGRPPAPSCLFGLTDATRLEMPPLFLTGNAVDLDCHPALPQHAFTGTPILVVSSILTSDAILTAQLLHAGVHRHELEVTADETITAARDRLRDLITEHVPQEDLVLVVTAPAGTNLSQTYTWDRFAEPSRPVIIGLESDRGDDWATWHARNTLRGTISAAGMNPENLNAGPGAGVTDHTVLDDLMTVGWTQLRNDATDAFPPQPMRPRTAMTVGTRLVADDGYSVEVLVEDPTDAYGRPGARRWETETRIGGRVIKTETYRAPTYLERETGILDPANEVGDNSRVTIETSWLSADGSPRVEYVTGPLKVLNYPPNRWDADGHASFSRALGLLQHPEWPPVKHGREWLSAVKANDAASCTQATRWTAMGWVPTPGTDVCSYISGGTVITHRPSDAARVLSGVTEDRLHGAGLFTLPEADSAPFSEPWKASVREDLDTLVEHYIDLAPWKDRGIAGTVLAAGLRSSNPLPTTVVLYAQGPSGTGKSWTASHIMGFHQARKIWTGKHLPGNLTDTPTATELALSHAPIWVLDDLAPSASSQESTRQQAAIGDIIRNVHNQTAKRRSSYDLKAQQTFTPQALLIVTAENAATVASVRDRTLVLNFDVGSLNSAAVDAMDEFRDKNLAAPRLLVAAVQMMQQRASELGWAGLVAELEVARTEAKAVVRRRTATLKLGDKSPERHVEMTADLLLGLVPLRQLAERVGHTRMLELLAPGTPGSFVDGVISVGTQSLAEMAEQSPGAIALESIISVIRQGKAHLELEDTPGDKPLPNGSGAANRALGWSADANGKLRPLGIRIGILTYRRKGGPNDLVYIDHNAAFEVLKSTFRDTFPHGSTARGTLGQLGSEGYWYPGINVTSWNIKLRPGKADRGIPLTVQTVLGEEMQQVER